ncbi:uncharacterized protein LOC141601732 [Silene latifolia]|uniref:uncharacterized protein LOC141601732 n=1 Tax=Silene latifolia TaxID=37657 RepID=UPI003D77074D
MATVPWMAKKIETELRAHPEMPVKSMADLLMKGYGIDVCLRTMYKVEILYVEMVYGGFEESYNSLAAYGEVIKQTNPGSWALITWHNPQTGQTGGQTGGPVHFKAMFVSFHSWILGFLRGCRPIIGVDGCHLKGRYKGMLLSAISVDANNNLYCISYAIVGKENTESWTYFFRNLRLAFQSVGCSKWDWTFISDRMKGVERALEKEFPQSTKRICAQHLYSNFKLKWGGPAFHDLFWRAANATSTHAFHKAIEEINKLSSQLLDYLLSVEEQWSKSQFDPNIACDHNTSNFVESFNALINDLREKPVMTLMEGIRTDFMAKMAERMEVADGLQMHEPTPYAKEILEYNIHGSNQCMVIKAGGGEFEVLEGTKPHPVDILKGTCLCGGWQITGIPCKHACRAIFDNREQPVDYVHGFYRGQCYKLTYGEHMHPLPNKDAWPTFQFPQVLPPIPERSIGRRLQGKERGNQTSPRRKVKDQQQSHAQYAKLLDTMQGLVKEVQQQNRGRLVGVVAVRRRGPGKMELQQARVNLLTVLQLLDVVIDVDELDADEDVDLEEIDEQRGLRVVDEDEEEEDVKLSEPWILRPTSHKEWGLQNCYQEQRVSSNSANDQVFNFLHSVPRWMKNC